MLRGRGWACAIENKPYALDQPKQLSDYWRYVHGLAGDDARIVYISGDSALPAESSMPAEQARTLIDQRKMYIFGLGGAEEKQGVRSLSSLLEEWQALARPAHLKSFIESFQRFIATQFGGEKNVMDRSADRSLARELLEEPTLAKTAFKIAAASREIQGALLERFSNAVEDEVQKRLMRDDGCGAELLSRISADDIGTTARLSFRPAKPESTIWRDNCFAVTVEVPRASEAFVGLGVPYPDNQRPENREPFDWPVYERISRKVGETRSQSHPAGGWPLWWELGVGNDRLQDLATMEALYEAAEGDAAADLAARVARVLASADKVFAAHQQDRRVP